MRQETSAFLPSLREAGSSLAPGLSDSSAQDALPLKSRCAVIIPTLNAARYWERLHAALSAQCIPPDQILIVDSTSDDDTVGLAQRAGYRVTVIPRLSFRHGSTRTLAAGLIPNAEYLIYLTQDAIPCDKDSLFLLVKTLEDPSVGAAYGRQLPRPGANAIESHARLFNYPPTSAVRDFDSRATLGFRAAFFSNSFAIYRRSALEAVGGFPDHVIVSEEVSVAARMLLTGWKLAYCAEARVFHSHQLSLATEFARYFDIAIHHSQERWIIDRFGSVGGEGFNFVRSEFKYLRRNASHLIPLALLRTFAKWTAYQCGRRQQSMPLWLKSSLSAQREYWKDERASHRLSEATGADPTADQCNDAWIGLRKVVKKHARSLGGR